MTRETVRLLMAIATSMLLVAALASLVLMWLRNPLTPDVEAEDPKEKKDQRNQAIDHLKGFSEKVFDVTLLLVGAVWGLALAEKTRVDLSRLADIIQFSATTLILLLSLACHITYRWRVANLLWDLAPKQPSMFSRHVDALLRTQLATFLLGVLAAGLTIGSIQIVSHNG